MESMSRRKKNCRCLSISVFFWGTHPNLPPDPYPVLNIGVNYSTVEKDTCYCLSNYSIGLTIDSINDISASVKWYF